MALAASLGLVVYAIDVDNAFQITPKEENDKNPPLYVTAPPLFMDWFQKYFPTAKIHGKPPYVLQCLQNMQGTKPAGREFYRLIKAIFAKMGIHPKSIDTGLFAFTYKGKHPVLLCTETDDFLMATDYVEAYCYVSDHLKEAFGITIQSGERINYLNFRILQSKYGISIDQIDHILDLLAKIFYPKSHSRKTDTPLRTDKQFDREVATEIPSIPHELRRLEKQYRGSYLSLYG